MNNVTGPGQPTYKVIFNGIRPDVPAVEARSKLAVLFKATPEQIDKLLTVPVYVLKKGLPQAVAIKYKVAIEAAGGACQLEDEVIAPVLPDANLTSSTDAVMREAIQENAVVRSSSDANPSIKLRYQKKIYAWLRNDKVRLVATALLVMFIGVKAIGMYDNKLHPPEQVSIETTSNRTLGLKLSGTYVCKIPGELDETFFVFYADGTYIERVSIGKEGRPVPIVLMTGRYVQDGNDVSFRLVGGANLEFNGDLEILKDKSFVKRSITELMDYQLNNEQKVKKFRLPFTAHFKNGVDMKDEYTRNYPNEVCMNYDWIPEIALNSAKLKSSTPAKFFDLNN